MKKHSMFQIICSVFWVSIALNTSAIGSDSESKSVLSETEMGRIRNAVPDLASARPKLKRKVLILSPEKKQKDKPMASATKVIALLGRKTGAYEAFNTKKSQVIQPEFLNNFDAICLVHCNDSIFLTDAKIRSYILEFINNGKGIASFHTTLFENKPPVFSMKKTDGILIQNNDLKHPLNSGFGGRSLCVTEKLANLMMSESLKDAYVLLSVTNHRSKPRNEYAVTYIRKQGDGRYFSSGFGGNESIYWNRKVLQHFLSGIQYILGDIDAIDSSR